MSGSTYLLPTGPAVLEDDALEDALQAAVVGVTGIAGNYVRPRYQLQPPQQPDQSINWCACGVMSNRMTDYNYQKLHDDLTFQQWRQSELEYLCSFYGPNSVGNANQLADGLCIPNNMWYLNSVGIKLIGCSDLTRVPDLTNTLWINRCDITVRFRRETTRLYGIPRVLTSENTIYFDENGILVITDHVNVLGSNFTNDFTPDFM